MPGPVLRTRDTAVNWAVSAGAELWVLMGGEVINQYVYQKMVNARRKSKTW